MAGENIVIKSVKFIARDIVLDILYWPIWWYTSGLKKAAGRFSDTLVQANDELALSIWIKNIFKPMFQQNDVWGRVISFFMRLAQIIFRSIAFMFWLGLAIVSFLIWLVMPAFLILAILFSSNLF